MEIYKVKTFSETILVSGNKIYTPQGEYYYEKEEDAQKLVNDLSDKYAKVELYTIEVL